MSQSKNKQKAAAPVRPKKSKLGFLRVIQVFMALNVIATFALLTLVTKDMEVIDFAFVVDIINIIANGISFWLIWKRKKVTKYFVLCICTANIVGGLIHALYLGTYDWRQQLFASCFDIFLILYFSLSKRVKKALTEPFSMEIRQEDVAIGKNYYRPKHWSFWRNLIIYFCIFSVVGHWCEAGYCTLIRLGVLPGDYDPNSQIWHDMLYPFCIYGFGACACVLIFYPIKCWLLSHMKHIWALLLSIISSGFICGLIELTMGLIMNQPVNGVFPLWDYSDRFCNFMGQVCLQNCIAFGLLAAVITWLVYPLLEGLFERIPGDLMTVIFIAVLIFFGFLMTFYLLNLLPDWLTTEIIEEQQASKVAATSMLQTGSLFL